MEKTLPMHHAPAAPDAGRRHLLGLSPPELRTWLATLDQPKYRADQLAEWLYARQAASFDEMTNLPKGLRARLAEVAAIRTATVVEESVAADFTRKLLLRWPDGRTVETVWIPDEARQTACLSSQVGCPVGCAFCASGIDGKKRDLTAGEIVEQALRMDALIRRTTADQQRLTHVVMMGMGEPLANYDAVLAAIRTINADWGLNIGARRITVSTVGLPQQIRKLAREQLQLNLALSLHAPDDDLRQELIPWGKVPIAELLAACRDYFETTGREITLEYILLAGVNDAPGHAARLARIARDLRANVNLLRYNPVPGLPYERPSAEAAYRFQRLLREKGVNAHIRKSRGKDIAAACGQLRRAYEEAAS